MLETSAYPVSIMAYNLKVYGVQRCRYAVEHIIAATSAAAAKRIAKKDGVFRRFKYDGGLSIRIRWMRDLRSNGAPRVLFTIPMG